MTAQKDQMLTPEECLRRREFAYSTVFEHPPLTNLAYDVRGIIRSDIPREVATFCKNESNCTVFLPDGTWLTTWGQGSFEHAADERIVFALSCDNGCTWSAPQTIIESTAAERIAYGVPFVAPDSGRIYLFFHAGVRGDWESPFYDSGQFYFIYSDNCGESWSERRVIELPDRDLNIFKDRVHAWINHSPKIMSSGEVLLPFSAWRRDGSHRRAWMLTPAECSIIRMDNILSEADPSKLRFSLLPAGGRGIRADVYSQRLNPALRQLCKCFDGFPEESAFNFQEMTLASLPDGRWLGVGRTFLGGPGFTVSMDQGATWSPVEQLRYQPGGDSIKHPMTMCPIAQTEDGRLVLLFTNNDGTNRGAKHVWEGNGRTRNPQWFVVAKQNPSEERNAGLVFGEPRILVEVDDSGETNLKTGISMPQFIERDGRYFVMYNINKEHLLLDEIPATTLDRMTPMVRG